MPSLSTAGPALPACHVLYAASLPVSADQSASVSVVLSLPSSGATALLWNVAMASVHAGLVPMVNGSALPASTLASGMLSSSCTPRLSCLLAMSAKFFSSPLRIAAARASNAASRQRAKKSSTLARTVCVVAQATAVSSAPSGCAVRSVGFICACQPA